MPLFMDNLLDDALLIREMAKQVALFWNQNGGTDYGFQVFVTEKNVKEVSRSGDEVLAAHFPSDPGPFKRVAATLVMARLVPLFSLATVNSTDAHIEPISAKDEHIWLPRLAYLLLEPALASVQLTNGHGGHTMIDGWHGFPSLHSKSEFLFWLEWLCDYSTEDLHDLSAHLERRGRMVLGTSLILEAVYYQNGQRSNICGSCDKHFFENCGNPAFFTFDKMLAANYEKNN